MKKINFTKTLCALTLAAVFMPAQALAASSVWKVSKGDDYLYVGGTVHLLPPKEFPLPVEFEKAYQAADVLVLEAKMPDPTDNQVAAVMVQKLSYANGVKLSQKLSPEIYQQLADYLKGFGGNLQQLDGFKPGFIAMQMALLEMHKAGVSGEGVDAYFAKKASVDNKAQQYLETVEFQIDMLANMGEGEENDFIRHGLEKAPETAEMLFKAIAAWRAGDLKAIDDVVLKDARQESPSMFKQMFTQRNEDWIPKITAMFGNQQRELVLVGAGHLPGEDGVLKLLEQAGYKIEQL